MSREDALDNVINIKKGSLLHEKMRDVAIAYRDSIR